MKQLSLLVLLLCACLLLTACTAADTDNLFEMPEGTTESTAEAMESTEATHKEFVNYTGTYPYGNMQKTLSGGGFLLLDNEVIFEFIVDTNSLLYAYALNTEEVRVYCQDATCKHKDCVAGLFYYNLEVYEGNLYGMVWPENKESAKETIKYPAVATENTAEIIIEANAGSFFHLEDKLYIKTSDKSLVVLKEGQSEPQMVVEEFTGHNSMIFGDYLYAWQLGNAISRVNLTAEEPKEEIFIPNASGVTDGQYIYYVDMITFELFRCNMDGSNTELLVDQYVLASTLNFDDEYVYYQVLNEQDTSYKESVHDIYRFSKEDPTQIEKIAAMPVLNVIYTVPGAGKLFATNYQSDENDEAVVFVMNSDGSDLKKLELPEA